MEVEGWGGVVILRGDLSSINFIQNIDRTHIMIDCSHVIHCIYVEPVKYYEGKLFRKYREQYTGIHFLVKTNSPLPFNSLKMYAIV